MWSTLIIMEVIPFLVLAVGVDNMFVLAHALQKQHAALPLATRMGLALATVGPSITLAASCEVAAFGLGALPSMPAVRNFSICASVAVLLDFLLQVGGLLGLRFNAAQCSRLARCAWRTCQLQVHMLHHGIPLAGSGLWWVQGA
jgi:Niemann-Pick C1 protein